MIQIMTSTQLIVLDSLSNVSIELTATTNMEEFIAPTTT